jgi:hypothetical protein
MRRLAVVFGLFAATAASAQSADVVQKRLQSESVKLAAWTAEKVVVSAIAAQNAQHLAPAEIQRRDREWIAGREEALVRQMLTGPCADRLHQLAASSPAYGETFVMDNRGALVCANRKTSDYWQGDEAKWQKSFNGGSGAVFIDRPRMDESAKEHLAQISLPIRDAAGHTIGAMTVGIVIEKLK